MTPEEFRRYWEATYPRCPPVSHLLRQTFEQRWLRIHALPASKRYAESEEEYREILRRHNTVLTDTLGDGQLFVLVSTGYSETPTPNAVRSEVARHDPKSRPFLSMSIEDGPTTMYWRFFMDVLRWEPGMADSLLRQVADDVVRNVLFVTGEGRSVYAPYDGGADLILPSALDRDAMRLRYAGWLSTHHLGL